MNTLPSVESHTDRQLIAVVNDADAPRLRQTDYAELRKKLIPDGRYLDPILDFFTVYAAITVDVTAAIDKLQKKLFKRGTSVHPVGRSEVNELIFPPGHPRIGGVYASHPTTEKLYYPVSDFHRLNFESKVDEAIRLLMALGANEIQVWRNAGWGSRFSGEIAATVLEEETDASVHSDRRYGSSLLFTAELDGSDTPSVPNDLLWYPYEPTWRSVAEGRLSHGLRNFNMSVNYIDDYGINAELRTQIVKSGLRLSGKFEDHVSTVWRLSGSFGRRK